MLVSLLLPVVRDDDVDATAAAIDDCAVTRVFVYRPCEFPPPCLSLCSVVAVVLVVVVAMNFP